MPRGTNLQTLITMLRTEAGQSPSAAAGVDNEPSLIQKLQRTQRLLYNAYDWPFMMWEWSLQMVAGERYYDFPTESGFPGNAVINLESLIQVWINYSGRPVPIERGVGVQQYASTNSQLGERNGPVRRWDIKRTTDNKEQIEVWPIPAGNTDVLWFKAKKLLRPLVAKIDVADLDDDLIVLHAAAEILARQGSKDAAKVASAASVCLAQLKERSKGGGSTFTLTGKHVNNGMGSNWGKTIIRIGSQTN